MENNSATPMAIAALAVGILGCIPGCNFGCIMGLVATILGKLELNKIDGGESSEAGRTFAKVGMILGITSMVIYTLLIIVSIVLQVFMGGLLAVAG